MYNVKIVSATGNVLEEIWTPINPIGVNSITTNIASYIPTEFSVDYKEQDIVVHVSEDIVYF